MLFGIVLALVFTLLVAIMLAWASFCDSLFNDSLVGFVFYMGTSLVVFFGLIGYLASKK